MSPACTKWLRSRSPSRTCQARSTVSASAMLLGCILGSQSCAWRRNSLAAKFGASTAILTPLMRIFEIVYEVGSGVNSGCCFACSFVLGPLFCTHALSLFLFVAQHVLFFFLFFLF